MKLQKITDCLLSTVFFVFLLYEPYLLVREWIHLWVTICCNTIRESILVVAVYDAIDLARIVMAIQAAIFLNAIVIDIRC